MPEYIVVKPKWIGVFRVYVEVIKNDLASEKAKRIAWEELERMARAADKWNEYVDSIGDKS